MKDEQELVDLLDSIRNDTEIAVLIINMNKENLVHTVLEDLFVKAQEITDRWCVKER